VPPGVGEWHKQEFIFELKAGDVHCEILFRALDTPDDVRKVLSLELTGAYINEGREVPKAILDMIGGRVVVEEVMLRGKPGNGPVNVPPGAKA